MVRERKDFNIEGPLALLTKKQIFTYHLGNLKYKCYYVTDFGTKINGVRPKYFMLEVSNFKKRLEADGTPVYKNRLAKYGAFEESAKFSDMVNMITIFQKYLTKHNIRYITISPFTDAPGKRMRIFDRMLKAVGYNIIGYYFPEYPIVNGYGNIGKPIYLYYGKDESEFIDRDFYEAWLKEQLSLERYK